MSSRSADWSPYIGVVLLGGYNDVMRVSEYPSCFTVEAIYSSGIGDNRSRCRRSNSSVTRAASRSIANSYICVPPVRASRLCVPAACAMTARYTQLTLDRSLLNTVALARALVS